MLPELEWPEDDELPEDELLEEDEPELEDDEWELEPDEPELLDDEDPSELAPLFASSAPVILVILASPSMELLFESKVPIDITAAAATPTIRIIIAKSNIMKTAGELVTAVLQLCLLFLPVLFQLQSGNP